MKKFITLFTLLLLFGVTSSCTKRVRNFEMTIVVIGENEPSFRLAAVNANGVEFIAIKGEDEIGQMVLIKGTPIGTIKRKKTNNNWHLSSTINKPIGVVYENTSWVLELQDQVGKVDKINNNGAYIFKRILKSH